MNEILFKTYFPDYYEKKIKKKTTGFELVLSDFLNQR